MKSFTAKAPYNMSGAYGNGYVVVEKDSPLYGKDYNDKIFTKITVNGGMTYSDVEHDRLGLGGNGWVFGFDTQHSWDTADMWPDEASVLREADNLRKQLERIEKRLLKKAEAK